MTSYCWFVWILHKYWLVSDHHSLSPGCLMISTVFLLAKYFFLPQLILAFSALEGGEVKKNNCPYTLGSMY